MKKVLKSVLAAGIVLLWCSGSSWAFPVSATDVVTMANDWDVPYTMIVDGVPYDTFCLESENYFTPGSPYTVTSVGDYATGGGRGDITDAGDKVEDETKWLYAAYMSDVFVDTDVTAWMVQNAIWWLEDEVDGVKSDWTTIHDNYYSTFDASGWDVRAVNLTGNYEDAQSQLVGVAPVPEPATMLLLGTGLIGLAGMSRKKFKK